MWIVRGLAMLAVSLISFGTAAMLHADPASPPTATGTLRFTEDLVIDPSGTDAELGRISGVVIASDGTIFVGDSGFGLIHAFDPEGNHLRSFGKTGDGPGDLPQRFFSLSIDPDDHLVITGNRSGVGFLDGNGDLVRSVQRNSTYPPGSMIVTDSGEIILTYPEVNWNASDPGPPTLIHILSPEGELQLSFATSSWWKRDYNPRWASALSGCSAALDPETGNLDFVQALPFELRNYSTDGTLITSTTNGPDTFLPEPELPEVHGDTTTFRSIGGARLTTVMPDGRIFIAASRRHPDDMDASMDANRSAPVRWQSALYLYDRDLHLIASDTGESPPRITTSDHEGRLWATSTGTDDSPLLIRYRYRID